MDIKYNTYNASTNEKTFWEMQGKVNYVDEWFLMKTPVPLILLTTIYLLFVLKLGPNLMKNRPKYALRNILLIYNTLQVIYSCFLLFIGSKLMVNNGLLGASCLMDTEISKWTLTTSAYYYFLAKVSELTDTILFVLRKNYRQVTFLHVYHHTMMMWCTWISLKFEPSQSTIFLGTLNSFVHIIMYGYYALSAFPELEKYLWWKKYITIMQMVQFASIILHAATFNAYSACPPSYTLLATILINALLFIFLFGKFYVNAYINKKNNKSNTAELQETKSK